MTSQIRAIVGEIVSSGATLAISAAIPSRAAAADPRFSALCVNGGTVRPLELPERFPRFWTKIEAMVGAGPAHARDVLGAFDLTAFGGAITCPLLQLHSMPDQVFLLENARHIHDDAASADKSLLIWDGDHCIYNHSEEKNLVVADWFAARLCGNALV